MSTTFFIIAFTALILGTIWIDHWIEPSEIAQVMQRQEARE